MINYRKDGAAFYCSLRIHPVVSRDNYGEIYLSHFVGIVQELPMDRYRVKCRGGTRSTMSQLTDSESDTSSNTDQDEGDDDSVATEQ